MVPPESRGALSAALIVGPLAIQRCGRRQGLGDLNLFPHVVVGVSDRRLGRGAWEGHALVGRGCQTAKAVVV